MPTKLQIFRTHARSLKGTLQSADTKAKEGLVGISLAKDFNQLLASIGEAYPELKEALPTAPRLAGPAARAGKAAVGYLDLELMADRVISVLDLIQED